MNNNPFISIVVPTYNRAHLIVKTLNSLLQQDYAHYEVIVVDDGSTDNTEEVVKAINDERLSYHKKENAERAAARNYGANLAKGNYVNFFDSDDIALPNHLKEAAKIIHEKCEPEWFHTGYSWSTVEGRIFKTVDNFQEDTLQKYIPHGNPLSCNGVFIRKDIITKNPFNEDRALSASEDYELWYRLAARYPLYYSNTVTSIIIDHDARSVRTINGEALIKRMDLLLHYLQNDTEIIKAFNHELLSTKTNTYAYLALHLSDVNSFKIKAIFYLSKAFTQEKNIIFQRRFLATIRNLVLRWSKY